MPGSARKPRFFFKVYDDLDTLDEEGRELRDVEAARAQAIAGAPSAASEQVVKGYLHLDHRIEVEDEARRRLFTITFDEAVSVKPVY